MCFSVARVSFVSNIIQISCHTTGTGTILNQHSLQCIATDTLDFGASIPTVFPAY